MVSKYVKPEQQITITHAATPYSFGDKTLTVDVVLRENAVGYCRLAANDLNSESFLGQADVGDNLQVKFRFADETATWTQRFGGWIEDLNPTLNAQAGELCGILGYGYGIGLANMLVWQQYGTQSENAAWEKFNEILTDAALGILPKYVHKVLNNIARDSGYSFDMTKIFDPADQFKYLYFTGKPAIKCLEDLCTLYYAMKAPAAGAHWIVVPDGTTAYLAVGTVGAHEAAPATVWPTWWNTDQAGSTIEVKKDMIETAFRKQRSLANYVLYTGAFRRPASGDAWTENTSGDWDVTADGVLADESGAGMHPIHNYSIKCTIANMGDQATFYYPAAATMSLDLTQIETKLHVPKISFYCRRDPNVNNVAAPPYVLIGTGAVAATNYYYHTLQTDLPNADEWRHIMYPIGNYYDVDKTTEFEWVDAGGDWSDVDYIGFIFTADANLAHFYVDGLYVEGALTRGACDSALYATQKCRMTHIVDHVGKDDSLLAGDDSGGMAQFAKAEFYRGKQTPITGAINIPMRPTILPGQLAHIHASKQSSSGVCGVCGAPGTFRIAKDMRIIEVHHHSSLANGARSYLTLTDDVTSSYPINLTDAYNALQMAVAPKWQDRVRSSILGDKIDLDQTILEYDY